MSDFKGLYNVRDYQSDDKALIMSTFLKGLYYGDSWFSQIPKDIFMDNYKLILENLINSPKVIIKVACLHEDSSVVLGYSILSSNFQTVHWVFVKKAWREKGIAKALCPQFPTSVSHLTELGKRLLPKLKTAVFNPFRLG